MANAPVLKTGVRKDLGVRIPRPPFQPNRLTSAARARLAVALAIVVMACSSTEPTPAPIPVDFTVISAGYHHTCAIGEDAAVYCWGGNHLGQLGDGTTTERSVPVATVDSLPFVDVTAAANQTCA